MHLSFIAAIAYFQDKIYSPEGTFHIFLYYYYSKRETLDEKLEIRIEKWKLIVPNVYIEWFSNCQFNFKADLDLLRSRRNFFQAVNIGWYKSIEDFSVAVQPERLGAQEPIQKFSVDFLF